MTPTRRTFLAAATTAVAAYLLASRRSVFAAHAADLPANVTIVPFTPKGGPLAKVTVPRIVKSDDEWKKQLSAISFDITRREGTERPFSSDLEVHDRGLFRCICCDNALFSSETKFDSHTGWPSFWKPIAKEMSSKSRTAASAWPAPPSPAASAMPTSATSSTTAPPPPASATA